MSEHPIFSPTLDGFVLLAYMLTVSAALWFAVLFRAKRYLFVKPSVILLLWTHVLFQWPSAIFSATAPVRLSSWISAGSFIPTMPGWLGNKSRRCRRDRLRAIAPNDGT